MENQVEHKDFDFNNKKIEHVLERKPKITEEKKKKFKLTAFLFVGAVGIGIGFGAITNFSKNYLIEKEKSVKIAEIQAHNEEIRKNQLHEVAAKKKLLQDEIEVKEQQKKTELDQKVELDKEKADYAVLMNNKDSLISNYEQQLTIYDKPYQKNIQAVKDGLMSLDDITDVRSHYQQYKDDIHTYIKFIHDISVSFEIYTTRTDENKQALAEELKMYQSGGLHRSVNLENALLNHISDTSQDDEDDEKIDNLRKQTKNSIIDDLADIINNDNITTKTKKLKM